MKRSLQVGLSGLLISGMLSACAANEPTSKSALTTPNGSGSITAQAARTHEPPDLQNRLERQLIVIFQALLQMDRKEGLKITADQALGMLPLLRKIKDEGQMLAQDQQQIVSLLSAEQKVFFDEASTRNSRMRGRPPKKFDGLSPEDRDKLIEEFQRKRMSGEDEGVIGPFIQQDAEEGYRNYGGPPPPHDPVLGISMEQQLIDLLEARVGS
ncbi:hypothetical protein D3C73_812550 [compost metagenome]